MRNTSRPGLHPGILTLAVTAFAIGVAEFIIVGILPSISSAFGISLASAGSLVGLYALALAIGTPLIVIGLGRFPRKAVLLGLIAVFLAGNLISALAPNYPLLLLGRVITALAHGSFFAIGATVAANLAREGQASKAIAVMFAGLTLAMVIGVPLGSYLGNTLGWRLPFYAVSLLALLALLATALPYQSLMVLTVFVWGIVAFGMTPAFQTGMLATARLHTPRAVDFASGLNISAFNLGITLGERAGSLLVESGQLALTPWAGVAAALLVHLPLAWLLWRGRRMSPQAC